MINKKVFMLMYWSLFIILAIVGSQYNKLVQENKTNTTETRTRHTNISHVELVNELQYNILGSDKRLSTNNQKFIFDYCDDIGIDPYFIMATSLTISNGHMTNLFKLKDMDDKDYRIQISNFLIQSGLVDVKKPFNILQENEKVKLRKPYLKAFTDLYGKQKLTRLYNNYYLIADKHLE